MCLQFFRDFHSLSKSNHDIWLIKKPNNHKTNRLGLGLERCTNYLPLSFLRQIVSNFFFSDLPRRALLLPPAIAIAPIAIIRLVITPAPATTDASVSASATATPFSTLARAPPRGWAAALRIVRVGIRVGIVRFSMPSLGRRWGIYILLVPAAHWAWVTRSRMGRINARRSSGGPREFKGRRIHRGGRLV